MKEYIYRVYMDLRSQNITICMVMVVYIKWKNGYKKTGSRICQGKINNNVKMLKGKISRSVGNSSEDSLCKFIAVLPIECGNFLKM
jgi:hypothetical protein